MAIVKQQEAASLSTRRESIEVPMMRWPQIFAISNFWFALNFHWFALGIIVLPSQVFKLVGDAHKGEALAFVLIPGAFVSLIANPLFGWLSDRTRGRFAVWGRRRPYILFGTLVNVGALIWMAVAPDILSLTLAYILVQLASNAAQAPFHALLPDVVPQKQRGMVSGLMGVLMITGNIFGAIIAGIFINASQPFSVYRQSLWITYGIIIAVLLIFMLVTILSVRERMGLLAQAATLDDEVPLEEPLLEKRERKPAWLTRSLLVTVGSTILTTLLLWLLLSLWNVYHAATFSISSDVQQVILEIVVTIGVLRLFDFNPKRDPDFAWVLVTRFLMMMSITTIQYFMQYYLHDVAHVADPEQETTKFVVITAFTSIASALLAGWLSDRFGRKRIIYISGSLMALLGFMVIMTHVFTHSLAIILPVIFVAGALFGLGYGAYVSVDWALVADVLPSHENFAKDMGVWNISLSLPQVIAPVIGGPLIDAFTQRGMPIIGFQILFGIAIVYCLAGTVTVRYIRGS